MLYNTRVEVNIIIKGAALELELDILLNFIIDIVFLNTNWLNYTRIYIDISILIGDIITPTTFLVIEEGGYNIILGRPY